MFVKQHMGAVWNSQPETTGDLCSVNDNLLYLSYKCIFSANEVIELIQFCIVQKE